MGLSVADASLMNLLGIGDGFRIESDHISGCVIDEIFQELGLVHVTLVADGTHLVDGKPPAFKDHHEKPCREHAALDGHGDIAGLEECLPDVRVHEREDMACMGIKQPHAVGTPEPYAMSFRKGNTLFLHLLTLRPHLGKARGLDDDALYLLFCTFLDGLEKSGGRDEVYGQVEVGRD